MENLCIKTINKQCSSCILTTKLVKTTNYYKQCDEKNKYENIFKLRIKSETGSNKEFRTCLYCIIASQGQTEESDALAVWKQGQIL